MSAFIKVCVCMFECVCACRSVCPIKRAIFSSEVEFKRHFLVRSICICFIAIFTFLELGFHFSCIFSVYDLDFFIIMYDRLEDLFFLYLKRSSSSQSAITVLPVGIVERHFFETDHEYCVLDSFH